MRCEHHISPEWRKSSYSGHGDDQGGSSCIEVLAAWRKSSYSSAGDDDGSDNCLEVNDAAPAHIHVRDSKRRNPSGPVLTVPSSSWAAFLRTLR
ncbi:MULTISPECIES: DUF397 domain-containing protein [Streptomyces]|uniref:DUF397 domain-containing protein n=1 Tax=Streptomyces griseocarneus TaxID=51201 RepID=A0ABX7RV84_9ACTN|nr:MULTISPECIES: DUF397 domain-containing protein [Streptomyces]QSY51433.1 DUF397 domain-containing protein [Streptomyces griseocarneus]